MKYDINEVRRDAGLPPAAPAFDHEAELRRVIDNVKARLEPLFDTEEGREALHELAEFIETNLNEVPM